MAALWLIGLSGLYFLIALATTAVYARFFAADWDTFTPTMVGIFWPLVLLGAVGYLIALPFVLTFEAVCDLSRRR